MIEFGVEIFYNTKGTKYDSNTVKFKMGSREWTKKIFRKQIVWGSNKTREFILLRRSEL
jgi:hypothetical protein